MSIKLVYFDVKGLAETSRILLALANVEYCDFRYSFKIVKNEDLGHTFSKPEFDEDKKNGHFKKSMGKLPFLEIIENGEEHIISQSKAIERYISKKYGYMGNNSMEEARIDSICEYIRDIRDNYKRLSCQKFKNDEEVNNYFNNFFKKELEDLVSILDPIHYCVGNKLSLADVSLYSLITTAFESPTYSHKDFALKIAGKNSRIREIIVKVANEPKIREWTSKYPV